MSSVAQMLHFVNIPVVSLKRFLSDPYVPHNMEGRARGLLKDGFIYSVLLLSNSILKVDGLAGLMST